MKTDAKQLIDQVVEGTSPAKAVRPVVKPKRKLGEADDETDYNVGGVDLSMVYGDVEDLGEMIESDALDKAGQILNNLKKASRANIALHQAAGAAGQLVISLKACVKQLSLIDHDLMRFGKD